MASSSERLRSFRMLEHMRLRNRFAHDYNSSLAEETVPQIVGPYVAWYDHLEKLILSYYD